MLEYAIKSIVERGYTLNIGLEDVNGRQMVAARITKGDDTYAHARECDAEDIRMLIHGAESTAAEKG